MTTDRPYAAALGMDEATLQIHAGKGKQFNPVVVDAFATVARRRPAEVMPPDGSARVSGRRLTETRDRCRPSRP